MKDRTGRVNQKEKRARDYNYKDDRDALKRSLNTMVNLLWVLIWLLVAGVVVSIGIFIRLLFI